MNLHKYCTELAMNGEIRQNQLVYAECYDKTKLLFMGLARVATIYRSSFDLYIDIQVVNSSGYICELTLDFNNPDDERDVIIPLNTICGYHEFTGILRTLGAKEYY